MISKVIVFVYLPGALEAVPAGTLTLTQVGREISSKFVYGTRYLQRPGALELDPVSLAFKQSPRRPEEEITPKNGLALFGAFRDATPDSWGRRVIERERKAVELPEIEYLLHSFDDRVGALDFRETPGSPPRKHPFNRIVELQYLMDCADKIDNDEPVPDNMLRLFQYGSSMGGARPKAVVEDHDGLWLAKFKARGDRFGYARVEKATLAMAAACKIRVPETRVIEVAGTPVFLIKRFDRERVDGDYARRHFVSALTLLGKDESESINSSYGEICENISRFGRAEEVAAMKEEMFRRMVFNILVSNTDDHLRNHAFLYEDGGYALSPIYDLVPTPTLGQQRYQHLGVGRQGRLSTLENALSEPGLFGLTGPEALDIVKSMLTVVAGWRVFYSAEGTPAADMERLQAAFRTPQQLGLVRA